MGPLKIDVAVIGEGITGLSIAHWLTKRGCDVRLLAKEAEAGGTMKTVREDGFMYETGANTALETTPLFRELIGDTKLEHEFVYAQPAGKHRFILRDGTLHSLPLGPGSFLTTKLFSTGAKLRLLKEPWIGRAEGEESIASFVERRLGREFLDYAIDPFVAGVFAGRPDRLSVRASFPKLYALEEKYGGLVRGMILGRKERKARAEKAKDRAETFSFFSGMQTLPKAIAAGLGHRVLFNAKVTRLRDLTRTSDEPEQEPNPRRYLVEFLLNGKDEELEADVVVLAVPAYAAAALVQTFSRATADTLASIYYSPVVSVFFGFRRQDVPHPLNGFGFLVPTVEKRKILGCLWNSSLFVNRAPAGAVAMTAFAGGARQPELASGSDESRVDLVLSELKETMLIRGKPVYCGVSRWEKAIPQYELGYDGKMDVLAQFEEEHPGLLFTGNYRGGISVGDCVQSAHQIAGRVADFIQTLR